MNKKLTTEQFIERATTIHGSRYNYSRSVYVSFRTPITVICPVHGEFTQLPSNHLKGSGCLRCSHSVKKSKTEEFVEKYKEIHGNKYDYSKTALNGMNKKITVICPTHGEFEQRAASHAEGRGCSKCVGVEKSNTQVFIERATEKHKGKYTYGNVEYVNTGTKVSITCSEHGDFTQTPNDHLRGYGCPECGGTKPVSKEIFIERAKRVHGVRYDYSKLCVDGMNTKGTITCPIHGEFDQRLADHVAGAGCPECSLSVRGRYSIKYFDTFPHEKQAESVLYLARVDDKFCKVGITKRNVAKRFANKKIQKVVEVKLPLIEAYACEQEILQKYKSLRFRANGLRSRGFSGWTECFPLEMLNTLKEEISSRDRA